MEVAESPSKLQTLLGIDFVDTHRRLFMNHRIQNLIRRFILVGRASDYPLEHIRILSHWIPDGEDNEGVSERFIVAIETLAERTDKLMENGPRQARTMFTKAALTNRNHIRHLNDFVPNRYLTQSLVGEDSLTVINIPLPFPTHKCFRKFDREVIFGFYFYK